MPLPPDDNLSTDYLTGREAAQADDNLRLLQGLAGEQGAVSPEAVTKAEAEVTAEDRTKKQGTIGGLATQAVGGVRDAVVESGQALESLTQWVREHTPLGALPEGPKLQLKLPPVRQPEGTIQDIVRSGSQFLTGFVPLFKGTRALGAGKGVAGAAAGALTDLAVFDPKDPRMSNLLNELAPALRTPVTEYLAADPADSEAEGRFKNVLEGLALGGLTEGIFRAAKVLKKAKGLTPQQLTELATSERGSAGIPDQTTTRTASDPAIEAMQEYMGTHPVYKQLDFDAELTKLNAWLAKRPDRERTPKLVAQWMNRAARRMIKGGVELTSAEMEDINALVKKKTAASRLAQDRLSPLVDIKRVTPEQAKEFLAANPDALTIGDRVLKVGWEQLGDQQGLEEIVNRTTQVFRQDIDVARRGKISDATLRVLARELDMPVEDFLSRRVGAALNAEQSLALVSILGASAKRLRGLAGQVAAGNLDLRQTMLDQLSVHAAIQEQAFGARAEAGRALRVWGMEADGTIAHASKLADVAQSLTGRSAAGLDAERMAQMILSVDSPAKLAKMTREATKPGWLDMAGEYWINALLSNPVTHVSNFLSNTLTTMWAIPERALAAQLRRGGEGVVKGEATEMLWGLIGGTMDGIRLAGKAFRDGVPVRPGTKVESYTRKAISGANMGASGNLGRAIDLLGTATRAPGRFLMASDEFFKHINFQMELHAQAVRQAGNEGLAGKIGARRVAELIQDPDFLKRVKPLADEFADYQTFTKQLGDTGSAIAAFRDSHPAAKLVLPFLRTPVNIFKYVGERTPFLNRLSTQVRADLAAGGARGDLARARVQLGGMVMASTAVLASSGYITGRGPRDPGLRREWLETHQPYSIKIGETWYGFNRLDPLGALLGMAADFSDIVGDLDELDAGQLGAAMGLAVSNNMLSKTYLTGLSDVLEAIQSPTDKAAAYLRRLGGTIVPAGVAQIARTIDPTIREVNSLTDAIIARVPGWSSTLPPKMNLWAEPIRLQGGLGPDLASPIYTKTPGLKPVSEELSRQGVSVSMPAKWIFGTRPAQTDPLAEATAKTGVPLEPAEYAQYVRLAAGQGLHPSLPLLKDALTTLIGSDAYTRQTEGPDGGKALLLKDVIYRYRRAAHDKLIADSPELQAQIKQKSTQRVEALRPGSTLLPQPRSPGRSGDVTNLTRSLQ